MPPREEREDPGWGKEAAGFAGGEIGHPAWDQSRDQEQKEERSHSPGVIDKIGDASYALFFGPYIE
jgi:hypothetical protein